MSTLTIAAVQFSIDWLNKSANLKKLDELLADTQKADLIILPETFATGFSIDIDGCEEPNQGGEVLNWLIEKAAEKDATIAGSVLVEQGDKKVNRFYWVKPNGDVDSYDKRHLFRFANEQDYVAKGQQRKIFEVKGIKILPLVCYDLRFPVWCRNRQDYDVMVNVANWPAARRNVWDILLRARAMENQCYVVGINRIGKDGKDIDHCGGTAVYDFIGQPIATAADNTEQVIYAKLSFSDLSSFKTKFPAYLDADDFDIRE